MEFFGTYQFDGMSWVEGNPEAGPSGPEPWLWIDIYDSDFATIRYAPAGSGSGVAYLNVTPRIYFESDETSAPTDIERESRALAEWSAALRSPGVSEVDLEGRSTQLAALLATDEEPDSESEDDANVFAEIKTTRFLATLGLPLPPDLQGISQEFSNRYVPFQHAFETVFECDGERHLFDARPRARSRFDALPCVRGRTRTCPPGRGDPANPRGDAVSRAGVPRSG